MRKHLMPAVVTLFGLSLPGPARSQQQNAGPAPPVIVLSTFKCDWPRVGDIISQAEAQLPYWEEQKAAGNIIDAGTYVHSWADEWNVGRFIFAPTMEAAVAANAAANQAFAAAHPESSAMGEACHTHRDNFYLGGPVANAPDAATGGNPTLVLMFHQCETSRIGDVLQEYETTALPVEQALVTAGKLRAAGSFAHYWADEWNVGFFAVAEDIPTFLAAWQEAGAQIPERPIYAEACPVHKDGFYTLGPRTNG